MRDGNYNGRHVNMDSEARGDQMEETSGDRQVFELTGTFSVDGTDAVVRYMGMNTGQEPLFVAHLPSDAQFKIYPNTAYCSLSPDGECINFILGDSPLPCDCEVEFGVEAFFMKVPQGEIMEGELRLAMPVQEWNGYFPPNRMVPTELVTVGLVALHIDVVPQSAVRWMRPSRTATDYWSVGGSSTRCSLIFCLDTALPVAKRIGNFPRP